MCQGDTHKYNTVGALQPDITFFDSRAGVPSEGSARGFVDFVTPKIDNDDLQRVAVSYCLPVLRSQQHLGCIWGMVMSPTEVQVLRVDHTDEPEKGGWCQISARYPLGSVNRDGVHRFPPETMATLRCFIQRVVNTTKLGAKTINVLSAGRGLAVCVHLLTLSCTHRCITLVAYSLSPALAPAVLGAASSSRLWT